MPTIETFGAEIRAAVARHLGPNPPALVLEPGRYLVGDAGVLQSEVLLVSRRDPADDLRWIYLDVGVFTGLVEAMGEAIRYPIRTPRHGVVGPAVLAGPTCDSLDVLYEEVHYQLPQDLAEGDLIELGSTGAYTSTCSSVGFNGFPPLRTVVVPLEH
jgi:ornithine decarboxylase